MVLEYISILHTSTCYLLRVGRTARGEGGKGHALLILRPEEVGFLRYLKQANVPLNEFEFSWSKVRFNGAKNMYLNVIGVPFVYLGCQYPASA